MRSPAGSEQPLSERPIHYLREWRSACTIGDHLPEPVERNCMDGVGYELSYADGELRFSPRRRGRHLLGLILSAVVGPLCVAAGIAAGQPALAVAALLAAVGVGLWYYRALLIASKVHLAVTDDGVVRWVEISKLSPVSHTRTLSDIVPDSEGYLFKVCQYVNRSPGAHELAGIPATVSVWMSRGPELGWRKLVSVRTIEPQVEQLTRGLRDRLPKVRPPRD